MNIVYVFILIDIILGIVCGFGPSILKKGQHETYFTKKKITPKVNRCYRANGVLNF